jgi:hypothetical protein
MRLQGIRRSVKAAESGGHHGCENDCARRRGASGGHCVSNHVAGSHPVYKNQLNVIELLLPPNREARGSRGKVWFDGNAEALVARQQQRHRFFSEL